jgi:hypothetical protein
MKKIAYLIALVLAVSQFIGCAATIRAIENRKLDVQAKMSQTIFLEPEILAENNMVFVRVTNTSDMQEIQFMEILKKKLEAKNLSVTSNPREAGYMVQANILYLGQAKQGITIDTALAGGFGGTIHGATLARDATLGAQMGAGLAGAAAGALGGALVGSMFHVDTWLGVTDVQVKELSAREVKGTIHSDTSQGTSTSVTAEQVITSNRQEYRTRIVVSAKQTNIDVKEACDIISERLASQIAGMF